MKLKGRLAQSGIIGSFGESFHRTVFPLWVRAFGSGPTELAFLLDGRKELSSVLGMIRRLRPEQVPSINDSLELFNHAIVDALQPIKVAYLMTQSGFVGKFTPILDIDLTEEGSEAVESQQAGQPVDPSAQDYLNAYAQGRADALADMPRLRSEFETLVSRAKEIKAALEEPTKTLHEDHHKELQQLTQGRREAQLAQQKAEQNLEQLKARFADVEASKEVAIAQGVERELSLVVRPWLEEARSLAGLSAARTDKSLAERAAALLHDQEALDMKYGSRTRLRRRLKDFEDYASKIRSALEDSIKPSQGLAPLLVDIESEIHRTRVILGEDRPQSQLVIKLEEALNKASTSDALDSLADNIAALHSASVFTHKEHVRLTKQTFKAYDRLRTREELRPAPAQRRSGRELCLVLGNNRKATVYLDGNNVVHRDDRYAHLFNESGKVNREVEEAFLRDVSAIASKCPAVTIRVVFDSHKASEQSISDNVIVQRSGGSGTDRADSAIVLHLLAEKPDGDSSFVMTDDIGLRQQTTKLGGVYADVAVWAVLLDAFGVELLPLAKVVPDTV